MNKLILKRWSIALATATTLMFFPASAHADPVSGIAALIGAVTTAASGGTLTAVLSGLAAAAFKIGVNMLISKMFEKEEKQVGVKDELDSGGNLPLSFIMGEYITAGKLIYANCGGNDLNDFLTLVISVSDIPITAFSSQVWINNELCNVDLTETTIDADNSGNADSPSDATAPYPGYHPIIEYDKQSEDDFERQYCWMRFYDGTQTVADPYLIRTFGSDPDKPWTSAMVGKGIAYVVVVCRYSGNGVWSGVPTFKFPVQGIKLYDVSKDSTQGGSGSHRWNNKATWEFSRNPKVMAYNIVRGIYYGSEWIWGGQNLSAYQLPSDYWITAIAHCNENITKADSTVVKRYTAGVEVQIDKQPLDLIKELDKTCAGYTTEYGGLWKTFAGPPGASIFSITDDDIIITEEQTDDLYRPLENTFNGATGTFTSPNKGWVSRDLKPYNVQAYKDADNGFELIASLTLPLVTEVNQAKRLMVMAVKDSRQQRSHIIQLPPSAYTGEPFSVINWNSARNGYVNKKFSIQAQDDLPNCNQLVVIRETNPSDYDYDVALDEADPVGVFKPIKPSQLALDFTVTADQIDRPGGGKDKPAINIAWTWGFKDSGLKWVKYEVRRSAAQPKVIAQGTFHNTEDTSRTISSTAFRFKQSFQVRLYAQPERTWQKSSWTAWKNVTLYDIDIPSAPTLSRVIQQADDGTQVFYLDISWTAVAAEGSYIVRVISDGVTRRYKAEENERRIPVTSGKTYVVDVRFKAADGGTLGDYSSSASITIAKKNVATIPAAAGLTIAAGSKRNKLDWTDVNDDLYPDYRNTWIWRNQTGTTPTPGTTPRYKATKAGYCIDDNLAIGATYYYWIAHKDNSGLFSSLAGPVSSAATAIGTADLAAGSVTDAITDQTAPDVPTGLTISQYAKDVDGDGRVDIGLEAVCDLNTSGVAVKNYEFTIRDPNQSKEWTRFGKVSRNQTLPTIREAPLVAGRTYGFYVRAISFNGTPSGWSARVDFATSKKSAAPSAPTGFTIASFAKGIKGSWTQPADADIRRYEFYVNTTNSSTSGGSVVKVGNGDSFLDATARTVGQNYYVFIRSVDRSDNPSAWVAASNNPKVFRGASAALADADFETTALPAPSATDPTPNTTASSVVLLQDNQDVNGDGKVDIALTASINAVADAASYEYEVTRYDPGTSSWVSTGKNGISAALKFSFIANTNFKYRVRARARNAYGQPGAWTTNIYTVGAGTVTFSSFTGLQPAPDPTSITATTLNVTGGKGYVDVEIIYPGGSNIPPVNASYVVIYYSTSPTMLTPSAFRIPACSLARVPMPFAGVWYFQSRIVTNSGVYGAYYPVSSSPVPATVLGITSNMIDASAFADGISNMAVGAVGTYAFLMKTTAGTVSAGGTAAGSALVYSDTSLTSGSSPSGTWMAMGRCPQNQATQWLRVA